MDKTDICPYCGHRFADAGCGEFYLYSKARGLWLEEAARQLKETDGDDDWVDWLKAGRDLDKQEGGN
jgi:hypothetical protein